LNKPFYQKDDFEDDYGYGGMAYERGHRRMTNPNPTRRGRFYFPN